MIHHFYLGRYMSDLCPALQPGHLVQIKARKGCQGAVAESERLSGNLKQMSLLAKV